MKLNWPRPKSQLKDVLYNQNADGPETAYWVFSELNQTKTDKWRDMTVVAPGLYGKEYCKTYGHYNLANTTEIYNLVSGEGVMLMQKKHIENGVWIPEMVDEFFLVNLSLGDELIIASEYAHSLSNLGSKPLITFDDWQYGHTEADYKEIKALQGMAFYLLNENGLKIVPNPRYKNLPTPKIVTVKEFANLTALTQ